MTPAPTTPSGGGRLLLTFVCAGIFMVYLDSTIVNVALPAMQHALHAGVTQLQWIIDGYALVVACLLLTAGTLGDIVGRKRVFLGGLVGFVVASALCAIAPSYGFLVAARVLQGAAGSAMIPVSLALVSSLYATPAARAKAIGIWAGIGGLALAAGPVLGGILVDAFGWQAIFWVNVPVGVIAFLVLWLRLPTARPATRRRPDVAGQLLFVAAIGALVYGLIEASARGWGSPVILGAFAVAAVALAAFVAAELRVADPMLPMGMFANPVLVVAGVVNLFGFFGLYGGIFLLTLYLQQVNGLSTLQAGLRFLALNVAVMVFSYLASTLAARTGPRPLILVGSLLGAAGLVRLATLVPGEGFGGYWWALVLLGAGASLVGAPATVALLSSVAPEQAGTASGVSNTFRQIGSVFGVALAGTLLVRHLSDRVGPALDGVALPPAAVHALSAGDLGAVADLPAPLRGPVLRAVAPIFTDGLHLGFAAAAIAALVGGALAVLVLPRRSGAAAPATERVRQADRAR